MTEASTNLSTDMAIGIAKKFLRTMAQPIESNQTGVSLWTIKDIENRQKKVAAPM
jgi:DNA excision repair protein ERCC-2